MTEPTKDEKNDPLKPICGAEERNKSMRHAGTDHVCRREYHLTGFHACRDCGSIF